MPCPSVSIIVPIYNAEKYLRRCVDSILAQSVEDFELCLVDDGSSDMSSVICDEYAERDHRVNVIHKPNGGVSSARNLGLEKVSGDYVVFVDADDWVAEDYIRHLLEVLTDDVDLVFAYSTIVSQNGDIRKEKFNARLLSSNDLEIAFQFYEFHGHTSPWGKLFRRSIIHDLGLRFCEEMHIGEDALFLFSYLLHCRNLYISGATDYYYNFESVNSLTKRVNSLESEYNGYVRITSILAQLCKMKHITHQTALSNIHWILGYYARRVLTSIYNGKVIEKRSTRIKIIKSLDLKPYLTAMYIPSMKEYFLAFLLKHQLFSIYDFVRMMKVKSSLVNKK